MFIILYGSSPHLYRVETALRQEGGDTVLRLTDTHLPKTLHGVLPGMIIYDQQQIDLAQVD